MILSKLKTYGLVVVGFATTILAALAMYYKSRAAGAKQDLAERNSEAAQETLKIHLKAENAHVKERKKSQSEVERVNQELDNNDFSDFRN